MVRRLMATGLATMVLGVACGGGTSPPSATDPTSTTVPPVTTTSTTVVTPDIDVPVPPEDPIADGDVVIDVLCTGLVDAIVAGADGRVRTLVAELSGAVAVSAAGSPSLRQAVLTVLDEMQAGGFGPDEVREAFTILAADFGAKECERVLDVVGLNPLGGDPQAVLEALARARAAWAEQGYGAGDYIMTVFFAAVDDPDDAADLCGLFGDWLVLVADGSVDSVVDRFSGCEVDVASAMFAGVPLTIDDMFDYIEANPAAVAVEFEPELGWPRSIDGSGVSLSIFVQDVRPGLPAGPDEIFAALSAQVAVWEAAQISDYPITLRRSCFCGQPLNDPYTVTVRSGEVVGVERNGSTIDLEDFLPSTVGDLFAAIESLAFADRLTVEYHPDFGYPTSIDADPVFNMADEEYSIVVEALTID